MLATLIPSIPTTVHAQTDPASSNVPPADLSKIKPSDFTDDELDLPYYLANFHRVANSIPLEGELRGWITLSVWRGDSNQRTYNARILESNLSLVYFYCTKRPWNPYYASPAVRARLEAMLERWCNLQNAEGKFSEYSADRFGVAPTAFATKFMGESLRQLAHGPPIDPKLHERVKQTQRRAILITLTDPDFWEHGRNYANQFSNAFAGGLAWLALFPDDRELRDQLMKRMREAATELQSPAGYFYERSGPDWGYNLSTHHSNLHVAWHYARGTAFEPLVLNEVRRFYEWLGWNAVIEPDGGGFVLNRAIETRQRRPWIAVDDNPQGRNHSWVPQAERVESARAFQPSREQRADARARLRAELESQWPAVPALQAGNFRGFTPYVFLHRSLVQWQPTAKQQAASQSRLPYQRDGRYAHLRADSRHDLQFLFVRRPNYYVAFNSGKRLEPTQRYGLGLLWAPGAGTLAQNQTASNEDAWGTRKDGTNAPYEAGDLKATIEAGGKPVTPEPGGQNLRRGELTIHYALGDVGRKMIGFKDDRIVVQTEHPGVFFESVPLLRRDDDRVRIENNHVILERRGKVALSIRFDPSAQADLLQPGARIGPYRVITARIKAAGKLSYDVIIAPGEKARAGIAK